MKNIKTKIVQGAFFLTTFFSAPLLFLDQVGAASDNILCKIFPFLENITFASSICTGDVSSGSANALSTTGQWIRFGLSLIFVAIIGIAIFVIIKAALKYIQSEGDEGKVEEATKAIKNVFIGIAALIIGIIGLVIILGLFSSGAILSTEQTPDELSPLIDQLGT